MAQPHFPTIPLGYVAKTISGGTPKTSNPDFWTSDEGINWVAISDMSSRDSIKSTAKRVTKEGAESSSLSIGGPGLILFAMYASVGEIAVLDISATWNQAILGIDPNESKINNKFLFYALKDIKPFLPTLYRSNTQNNLNAQQVNGLPIPLPDLDTQRRIADYLDTETNQIDAMMAKLDKQVELLEERYDRLKTDLPSPINSSVKDQTINGEYREGWSVKPLQSLFRRKKVLGHVDEPMVSVFKQHGVVFKDDYENLNRTANDRSIYQLVDRGWFVVNRMKAWSGSVGVSTIRGISSGHYICFEPFHEESDEYLNLVLRSRGARDWYFKFSRGVRPGQAEIDNQWLLQLPVPLPPLNEQRRIVAELDEKTSRIDTMITKCEELKTLLQERRAALITAVVTGQKEVPHHD